MKTVQSLPYGEARQLPCAVIITALGLERQAVVSHLSDVQRVPFPESGALYYVGDFVAAKGKWQVVVAQVGRGNTTAAAGTERAIEQHRPKVALLVGVAGGLKDVRLGDVVVATKVYEYEAGKAGARFQTRPNHGRCTAALLKAAEAEATESNWLARLGVPPAAGDEPPRVVVEPIASGSVVVASRRSRLCKFLAEKYGDAVAVEMEGFGFLEAATSHRDVEALVVRGISDVITGKARADAQGWQRTAASNAAAFAFEVLAQYSVGLPIVTSVGLERLGSRGFIEVEFRMRLPAGYVRRHRQGLRRGLAAALGCELSNLEIVEVRSGSTILRVRFAWEQLCQRMLAAASTPGDPVSVLLREWQVEDVSAVYETEAGRYRLHLEAITRPRYQAPASHGVLHPTSTLTDHIALVGEHDLGLIIRETARLLRGKGCSLFLREKGEGAVLAASFGLDCSLVGKASYAPGEGLTGWVLKFGRSLRLPPGDRTDLACIHPQLQWKSKYIEFPDDKRDLGKRPFLAVPVVRGNETIGVIRVSDREDDLGFTEQDELLLEAVASHIARVLDDRHAQAQALNTPARNEATNLLSIGKVAFATKSRWSGAALEAKILRLLKDAADSEHVRLLAENLRLTEVEPDPQDGPGYPGGYRRVFQVDVLVPPPGAVFWTSAFATALGGLITHAVARLLERTVARLRDDTGIYPASIRTRPIAGSSATPRQKTPRATSGSQ